MEAGEARDVWKGKIRTVWKGVDLGVFARVPVDAAETGEGVLAINVHGTRPTDTLSARAPESESGVYLVLDLDEGIEHLRATRVSEGKARACMGTCHGSGLVEVDGVGLEGRFLFWLVWVLAQDESVHVGQEGETDPAVDLELLHQCGFLDGHCMGRGCRRGKGARGA